MPYGKEAKELLLNIVQGKCLQLFVYGEDRYNRCVADIYCSGLFVQVCIIMIKEEALRSNRSITTSIFDAFPNVLIIGTDAEKGMCMALCCI